VGLSFPKCKGKGYLTIFAFLVDLLERQYIILTNLFTEFVIMKLPKIHNPKKSNAMNMVIMNMPCPYI
jgi:hypothetical protein